jgi:hypothetical protein
MSYFFFRRLQAGAVRAGVQDGGDPYAPATRVTAA